MTLRVAPALVIGLLVRPGRRRLPSSRHCPPGRRRPALTGCGMLVRTPRGPQRGLERACRWHAHLQRRGPHAGRHRCAWRARSAPVDSDRSARCARDLVCAGGSRPATLSGWLPGPGHIASRPSCSRIPRRSSAISDDRRRFEALATLAAGIGPLAARGAADLLEIKPTIEWPETPLGLSRRALRSSDISCFPRWSSRSADIRVPTLAR